MSPLDPSNCAVKALFLRRVTIAWDTIERGIDGLAAIGECPFGDLIEYLCGHDCIAGLMHTAP